MSRKYILGLVFACLVVLIPYTGMFFKTSQTVNDTLYQETNITNSDFCIIGIDEFSIDELGSFPFDRSLFAELLDMLNSSDTPPIAIGVDVLFTGESNEDSDGYLVEVVEQYDNIILACSANYSSQLVLGEGNLSYIDLSSLTSMNYPFPALKEVANLAHINSSLDEDSILRHSILSIVTDTGETLPSLHLALYQKYCEAKEMSVGELPSNVWYLPYTAKSGGYYDGYSFAKVLSGEIPTSVFKDKIVLIGPYTIGLQDHFFTAIDHGNIMYGVEYQANSLQALVDKNFVSTMSSQWEYVFLFVLSFFLFVVTYQRKLWVNILVLIVATALYLFVCQQAYDRGVLLDVLYVLLSFFMLFLCNIVVDALTSSVEKRKITDTFKRYVAPVVVEEILREGVEDLQLGGKSMDIAVMFIDVRNFTPMSNKFKKEPEIVVEILNKLLNEMAETIMGNQGTLDKFIGDAIMCFWGAPFPQEDYVHKAVTTAVEITENLQDIIKTIEKEYEHKVTVGIGIHCGKAIVGNIGSEKRMDFTIIGDTVNIAARLESNAKLDTVYTAEQVEALLEKDKDKIHNLIVVSEDVVTAVREQGGQEVFSFEEIPGGLELKGKEGIFRSYTVSKV